MLTVDAMPVWAIVAALDTGLDWTHCDSAANIAAWSASLAVPTVALMQARLSAAVLTLLASPAQSSAAALAASTPSAGTMASYQNCMPSVRTEPTAAGSGAGTGKGEASGSLVGSKTAASLSGIVRPLSGSATGGVGYDEMPPLPAASVIAT